MPQTDSVYDLDIEKNKDVVFSVMQEMRVIMIKGIGYVCVPKNEKITDDLALRIAECLSHIDK